jgi:hypothetical protein
LTLTTNYTVTINANGTGSVTLLATAGTSNITIVGGRTVQRTTDFVTGGDFFANTLNDELDSQTIFIQQIAETAERGLKAPVTDPTDINMTLPTRTSRANKYLVFDANGNPAPGDIPPEVELVGDNIDAIIAVNDNETNINTVAGQITPTNNVATVAGVAANITTVAGVSANVTTVAGISASVTAVAGDATDIGLVAANIADVQALGPVAGDLGAVIDELPAIVTVAADLDGDNTIGTVAANIAAVEIIGSDLGGSGFDYDLGSITDAATGPSASPDGFIITVYDNLADITTVADNTANVNTVAGISANVTTVAGISANVTSVAGNATNINTVATNIANVNSVGTNIANVNATATNITNVNAVGADLLEAVSEINTVATSIANVDAVGTNISNVNSVAGNATNINAVAGNATNINTVATNNANVTTVAGISANVTTVAGISASVTTVATNVADITNFSDVYLGPKTTNPTVRNDSSALQAGDLYFNTVDDVMKVYTGSAWSVAYVPAAGFLVSANNLSDLTSTSTARTNLGLGALATLSTVDTAQIDDGAITSAKLDTTLDLGSIA